MGGLDSFESLGPFCCRTWLLPVLGADLKARTLRPTNTRPFGLADLTLMLRLGVVLKIIIFLKILGRDPVGKRLGVLSRPAGNIRLPSGGGGALADKFWFKIIKRSNWVYVSNPKSKSFCWLFQSPRNLFGTWAGYTTPRVGRQAFGLGHLG